MADAVASKATTITAPRRGRVCGFDPRRGYMWYSEQRQVMLDRQELQLLTLRLRHSAARLWLAQSNGNAQDAVAEKDRIKLLNTELAAFISNLTPERRTATLLHSARDSDSGREPGSPTSAEPLPEPEAPQTTAP